MKKLTPVPLVLALALLGCGGNGGGRDLPTGTDTPDAAVDPGPVDGDPCDDGDPCTSDDKYVSGECKGEPYECEGNLPFCVTPACDGKGGCTVSEVQAGYCYVDGACFQDGTVDPDNQCLLCDSAAAKTEWTPASSGKSCNDGDACTSGDQCEDGVCTGTPMDCDDGNPCTKGTCEPGLGCVQEDLAGPCDDGDPCTVGDTCQDGKCSPGGEALDCDDGDPCTVDRCEPGEGCVNEFDPATACDDGNQCTEDTCGDDGKCAHSAIDGECEDGDLCTLGDTCKDGVCVPGDGTPDCDDGNPCTGDECVPAHGCIHPVLFGDCDDGNDCTVDDACLGGKCVGEKTQYCQSCEVEPNPNANKITVLQIGSSGHPGQGLDLDMDPDTCAPANDCSGGVDNELGILAPFVNPGIAEALDNGYFMYVVEFKGFNTDGDEFTMNIHGADLAETDIFCDYQNEECSYYPLWVSFDAQCNPVAAFDNARFKDGVITAGGKGYNFAMRFTLLNGEQMMIAMMNARMEASVKLTQSGSQVFSMQGLLGGAVNKSELLDSIDKLPEEAFPLDKETVKNMLETLIAEDLDSDGDGEPDAASAAFRFSSIPADLVPKGQ